MKQQFWKRPWFLISMSISLIIILLGILLFKDIDPVDPPEHLRYVYPEVSDEDNIYVDLIAALNALELLKDSWFEKEFNFYEIDDEAKKFLVEADDGPDQSLINLRNAILEKNITFQRSYVQ